MSGRVADSARGEGRVKRRGGKTAGAKKGAGRLYAAGEVAREAGISRQVLHHYTVLDLVGPAERTPAGRRLYGESVFRRLRLIRRLLDSGYTLQALREIFPWRE